MMEPGSLVVVYARDPRQRFWGVLHALQPAGITVEGCDVEGFDAWLRACASGEGDRAWLSVTFFPMARIERMLLDRGDPTAPSLGDRFSARLGHPVQAFLDGSGARP